MEQILNWKNCLKIQPRPVLFRWQSTETNFTKSKVSFVPGTWFPSASVSAGKPPSASAAAVTGVANVANIGENVDKVVVFPKTRRLFRLKRARPEFDLLAGAWALNLPWLQVWLWAQVYSFEYLSSKDGRAASTMLRFQLLASVFEVRLITNLVNIWGIYPLK